MIITKQFEVESAHIVRNCTSERCSHSIHGHSAKIEVSFECETLDNAQMIMDFGLMKGTIKQLIDSMDHCYLLCSRESDDYKKFIKSNCDRWIEMPFNPSAEMLSVFIFRYIKYILAHTKFNNGEGDVKVHSVRYWETRTGSATAFEDDIERFCNYSKKDIIFSDGVMKDWSTELKNIMNGESVSNSTIKQQIILN